MITVKINNIDIEGLNIKPIITLSKSYRNNAIYFDKTEFSVLDENGTFIPFSENTILNDPILENNKVEIFDNTFKIYEGYINELRPDRLNEKNVTIECVTGLKKYLNNRIDYNTWSRGGGAFPTGEYYLHTDNLYYETPIYALWHYLQELGYTNFDTAGISNIHEIFTTAGIYVQIDTTFQNMLPHVILNYLCKKFFIFVYEENGIIVFDHARNYNAEYISITQEIKNDIQTIEKLDKYTDYKIEVGTGFRTATDNSNYGSEYRTEYIESYDFLTGLIYIMDNTTADYFGEYAIDKFYRDRKSLRIIFDISTNVFNLKKGIKITALQRGWNEKLFEPYILKQDYNTRKYIVDCFEVL